MKKNIGFTLIVMAILALSCANHVKNIESTTYLVLDEPFNDNSNDWKLIKNQNFLVDISQGVLHIEKFKKNRVSNGCLWYKKAFNLFDAKNDFVISFDAKLLTFDDIYNGLDFQWGNDSLLYQLTVTDQGKVDLKKFDRNYQAKWIDIDCNYNSKQINKTDFNEIYIVQIKSRCIVLVNNKVALSTNIIPIDGNQIGFQQCLKVSWELDNLKIRKIKN